MLHFEIFQQATHKLGGENFSRTFLKKYMHSNNYELVKNNKDLLKLLKLKGIHFENSLRNDPLYSEQYEVFRNLL